MFDEYLNYKEFHRDRIEKKVCLIKKKTLK